MGKQRKIKCTFMRFISIIMEINSSRGFFNSYDKCEFYARTNMLKEFNIDPNDITFHEVIEDCWSSELDEVWVTEPWDYKVIVIRKYILGE